jgi:hypothetical protein
VIRERAKAKATDETITPAKARNHHLLHTGGNILNATTAGFSLIAPFAPIARTRKR